MNIERRLELRAESRKAFAISWKDTTGMTRSADVQALNISHSGMSFRSAVEIPVSTVAYVEAHDAFAGGYICVRHCGRAGDHFVIGAKLDENAKQASSRTAAESHNYYEFLQISSTAQAGTIHRVFRYLAGRYHPDNPETGDPERFLLLNRAYKVLSDSQSRAAYDEELARKRNLPSPAFAGVDFLDGVEGELNRRLAVLSVLYRKCRANINDARVSLLELEAQMGFPREYLDFTTWYLRSKKYITKQDNSDFTLTATGVDFVEENYERLPLLRKLLSAGRGPDFNNNEGSSGGSETPSSSKKPTILLSGCDPAEPKPLPAEVSPTVM